MSYKNKVNHKTILFLLLAIKLILSSDHYKKIVDDFPFDRDLKRMHAQLMELEALLKEEPSEIKFTLTKSLIIRYIFILKHLRERFARDSFRNLFPELFIQKAA